MEWKRFEQIIEQIHREWAPTADVQLNEKIRGRSGRRRELDVTLRGRIGPYSIFIVIECKDQSRPVSITQLEAFAKKLDDVGASQGVMIARSGFSKGAKAIALQNHTHIRLLNHRDAQDADSTRILGDNINFFFAITEVHQEQTEIDSVDDSDDALNDNEVILTPSGQYVGTVKQVRAAIINKVVIPARLLGKYEMRVRMDGFTLQTSMGSVGIRTLTLLGRKTARRFFVRADTPTGHIIEDVVSGNTPFAQIEQTIPWAEITAVNEGHEISLDEYSRHTEEPVASMPISIKWSDENGQLRLTFTRTSED